MTLQKIARLYFRVSTAQQDTKRQEHIIADARSRGFYIAGIYSEKISGATLDRPELQRLLKDLQPNDVIIAEKLDRLTRLPLEQAEELMAIITAKGARLSIPDVLDLSEVISSTENATARIVLDAMQAMLLRIALQESRNDYENRRRQQKQGIAIAQANGTIFGKRADADLHSRIITLREAGYSLTKIASLAKTSLSTVNRVVRNQKTEENI